MTLTQLGRYDEAIALNQKAIAAAERAYGGDNDLLAGVLDNFAFNLAVVGRTREARTALDRALAMKTPTEFSVSTELCDLARVDLADGKPDQAIEHGERGLALLRKLGFSGINIAINEDPLAGAYLAAKRFDDALALSRDCLAEFRKGRPTDGVDVVPCLRVEGTALVELGRTSEAQAELELALRLQAAHPAPPGMVAELRFQLARALVATGGDRARAAQLADDARAELVRYSFEKARLDELDAWRAARLPP